MKRNVLALSITAALIGIGYAGGAQAIGLVSGLAPISGTATNLASAKDGVGQFLLVPYYSAQAGNNTMINLVNTDTQNGKAVKVRFRGAANSDDLFDFQVFLSPNDVWAASISMGADGLAKLYTDDTSCTKPARGALTAAINGTLNGTPFRTDRFFGTGDAAWRANQTREGYVEIFNMADIPFSSASTSLYQSILHSGKGGNPGAWSTASTDPAWGGGCASAAFVKLDNDPYSVSTNGPNYDSATGYQASATTLGLAVPTTGLFANWIILNATDAGAWSGAAPALVAVNGQGAITSGALVYFPQLGNSLAGTAAAGNMANFTADGWLIQYVNTYASFFDLPDFSTPYTGTDTPAGQAGKLAAALATTNLYNEYLTGPFTTDWVLSMPTRRYFTQYDYVAGADPKQLFGTGTGYFTSANTVLKDNQICVTGVSSKSYDREEYLPTSSQPGPIISPRNPDAPNEFLICGEVSVLSFNHGESASASGLITSSSGTLKASVARSAIENGNNWGWTNLFTPNTANRGIGLPVLGFAAYRGSNGAGVFGATLPHRTNLVNK